MAGKRSPTVTYLCERCSKKCTDLVDGIHALLGLCEGCQAERYAKGKAEQAKALAAEARAGGGRG
jgi:DNA-directed RNA polymerase subunit RPC12/RpoP